jgi:hypothetical protein
VPEVALGLLIAVACGRRIDAPTTAAVVSVTVSPPVASVYVGSTQQLTAAPRDAGGNPLPGRVVTWNSDSPAVATVSGSGLVTGLAAGAVTITATSEGKAGSVALTVVTRPPPSGVLFASDWSSALGNTDAALRDGGKWDVAEVGGTTPVNPNEAVVVNTTAPLGATNALRLQQQGASPIGWARVAKFHFTLPSGDYYVRYYVRNDDVSGAADDHVVEPGLVGSLYNDLTYLNKGEFATGWRPRFVLGGNQGPNTTMPNWDLGETGVLAYGRWYRFEYWVHFTAPNRIQVHPRIYDDTGALLYSDTDFKSDPGYGQWAGASLASYYANSNPGGGIVDFGITPLTLVNIEFGNNGSARSVNTGLFWYFGNVMIRGDTWAGP